MFSKGFNSVAVVRNIMVVYPTSNNSHNSFENNLRTFCTEIIGLREQTSIFDWWVFLKPISEFLKTLVFSNQMNFSFLSLKPSFFSEKYWLLKSKFTEFF